MTEMTVILGRERVDHHLFDEHVLQHVAYLIF